MVATVQAVGIRAQAADTAQVVDTAQEAGIQVQALDGHQAVDTAEAVVVGPRVVAAVAGTKWVAHTFKSAIHNSNSKLNHD